MMSPMVSCGPCQETSPVAANAVKARVVSLGIPMVEMLTPCCGRTVAVPVSWRAWWLIRRLLVGYEQTDDLNATVFRLRRRYWTMESEAAAFRLELERAGVAAASLIGGTDG